jgi:hypothetical protein
MSDLQEWREQTQNLTLRVREAIADAAIEGNLTMVQTLTEALSPLQGTLDTLIESRRTLAATDGNHSEPPQHVQALAAP